MPPPLNLLKRMPCAKHSLLGKALGGLTVITCRERSRHVFMSNIKDVASNARRPAAGACCLASRAWAGLNSLASARATIREILHSKPKGRDDRAHF